MVLIRLLSLVVILVTAQGDYVYSTDLTSFAQDTVTGLETLLAMQVAMPLVEACCSSR